MKWTKALVLGLVVAALSTLAASEALSWSRGPYVDTRSVFPQVYVGYPSCVPGPTYVYDEDPWVYYGPTYRPWRQFRLHHRPFRHHRR